MTETSLEVVVLPFNLEKPQLEYSIYYRGVLDGSAGSISSEVKNEEQLRAELRNMLAHGVPNPTVYQSFDNKALLKRVLQIRKEVGMTGQPLYYLGIRTEEPGNPTAVNRYVKQTREMLDIVRPFGITNLYIYGIDEAPPGLLQKQRAVWQTIQRAGAKFLPLAGLRGISR